MVQTYKHHTGALPHSLFIFFNSLFSPFTTPLIAAILHCNQIIKHQKSIAMKKIILYAAIFLAFTQLQAQTPEGFTKGSVTLADGSIITGFVQDNIKKGAAIMFISSEGGDKKLYNSTEINAVLIDATNYISLKGDLFKVICTGKMNFLQKASNAAGKTIYNGSEAIIIPGTEGKIGDHFSYTNNQLTLINKKTVDAFIADQLSTCTAAVEKAKTINGDIAALAEAVTIYNTANK